MTGLRKIREWLCKTRTNITGAKDLFCMSTKLFGGLVVVHWHKGGRGTYGEVRQHRPYKENRLRAIKLLGKWIHPKWSYAV